MLRRAALLTLLLTGALAAPAAAAITVDAPTVTEGGDLVFTIQRESLLDGPSVTVGTADGTAAAPGDYTAVEDRTVVFSALLGPDAQTVTVATAQDSEPEGDETVQLVAKPPRGDAVTGTGTITDDDPPPLTARDAGVDESDGSVQVPIDVTPTSRAVTFAYSTAPGTAAAGADFTPAAGRLTIPAGATRVVATIPVVDDAEDEDVETFTVNLAPVEGTTTLADGQATVTITSDNDVRALSVGDAKAVEGDGRSTVVRIPVALSGPTFRTVTAQFTTVDHTARAPSDYLAKFGTISIPAGQTTAVLEIAIVSDDAAEKAEQFLVYVGRQAGAALGRGTALVTIEDDDTVRADTLPPNVRTTGLARSGRRAVRLRVSCPRNERRCRGRATFYTRPDRRAKARALRREQRLGRRTFSLAGGKAKTLKLRLRRSIVRAARRSGRLRLRVFVVTDDLDDNRDTTTAARTLRFRR